MNKREAASIINKKWLANLNPSNNGNVSWANINASKDVWWIDIPTKKFFRDFHLILNDEKNRILHWIFIPSGTFKDPYRTFRKLREGYISVELSSREANKFVDVKSGGTNFDFNQFQITTINHEDSSTHSTSQPILQTEQPTHTQTTDNLHIRATHGLNTEACLSLEEKMESLFQKLSGVQKEIHSELVHYSDNKVLKGNEIVGWLGEIYGKLIFDGKMVDDSFEHDIETPDGKRISIKTRKGWNSGWRQTSAIPKIEGDNCPTHLLFVHLDDDYSIHGMWLFEWDYLLNNERFRKHMVRGNLRSFIFHLNEQKDEGFKIYP